MQRSDVFLYSSNEKLEIKVKVPFTIEYKYIKYLVIDMTKEVQDLFTECYKILLRKLLKD